MKAKELIERLEEIVAEHGDLEVEYAEMMPENGMYGDCQIKFVIDTRTHICLV